MKPLALPRSLWAATAPHPPTTHTLSGEKSVDVAIVGAGYTGLRAALVLAEAGVAVAVVDAGDIGWGASGRNGGQVNPIGHEAPDAIAKRWQHYQHGDYAERYVQMTIDSADELFALIRKHNIQCDAEQNGWIRAVHGEPAEAKFEQAFLGWQAAGANMRLIDQNELESLSGSRAYKRGWVANSGGSVQPLSYARGLAQAAQNAGAAIFTHTRIQQLIQHNNGWRLMSSHGSIYADKVILATNGYTDNLMPSMRKSIVPVVSIQGATKPLTPDQNAHILRNRQTFADTRRVIFYFRKTADNRLVFGSAGSDGETPRPSDRARLIKGLRTVYPQYPDLQLEYIWGGQIAVTQDYLPHIHQPRPGLYAGLGCNGRGVALSTVLGRILAEVATGAKNNELPIPVSDIKTVPFHQFHRAGIKLAVAWQQWRDSMESTV